MQPVEMFSGFVGLGLVGFVERTGEDIHEVD